MSLNSLDISIISLVVSLLSMGIALSSYIINLKSFRITLFSRVLENVGDKDARENRRITRNLEEKKKDENEWRKAAFHTSVMCDRIGILLEHDQALEKKFFKSNADWIADVWLKVEELVRERRNQDSSRYVLNFDKLAERAIKILNIDEIKKIEASNQEWHFEYSDQNSLNRIYLKSDVSIQAFPLP